MSNVAMSNPVDRKKVVDALTEISNSMTRIAAERDLIKEIINEKSEEFQLDKKIFRRMAKVFHKDSFSEEVAESSEFEVLYENIVQVTTPPSQGE
jgi:hypothetical protein